MDTKESRWWDEWNTRTRLGEVNEVYRDLRETLVSDIASVSPPRPRVIEIGCGTGWFARRLSWSDRYLGLDLSPAAIEAARTRVPAARFVVADFHEWDSKRERFDIALMIDSIAYFRDQDLVTSKVHDLLEPGGHIVLSTVNPVVYSRLSWVGPPGDGQVRKWLTRQQLAALLQRNGFRLVAYRTVQPAGDRGILRVLNSPTINKPVQLIVPERWVRRAKERCGLGRFQIVVARKES